MMNEEDIVKIQLEQSQQQIDSDPHGIQADVLREERIGNILEQLNPDNLMNDIEHRIRGEKWDKRSETWVSMTKEKKDISEKLIANFMGFLGAVLNQNVSMSNFSSDEINRIMELIINFVAIDLTTNDEEYNIVEDYSEMTRIGHIICISCLATFKQALNGTMSKRIFGAITVKGSLSEDSKPTVAEAFRFWK